MTWPHPIGVLIAAALIAFNLACLYGCPDSPSPRWPEQHHAEGR